MFQGLPHYYNYVLNRLNALPGMEVVNVVAVESLGIGAGVYQTRQDITFRLYELEEFTTRNGGAFLKGISRVLWKERPDIVVVTPPHCLGFDRSYLARLLRRVLGFKLILKSIPFQTPTRQEQERSLDDAMDAAASRPSPFAERVGRVLQPLVRDTSAVRKLIHTLHNPIRRRLAGRKGRTALRRVTRLAHVPDAHVNYIEEGRAIIGSYGVDASRIFVIYNSPDTDRLLAVYRQLREGGHVHKHPHRIIHVGRLVEWKRVDLLLRAFTRLRKDIPDADLLVVGSGPKEEAWRQLAEELNVSDAVQFLGDVHEPQKLGALLMSSVLYVLAGMGGISINDAMCFGLPVVCSVCDGTEKKLVKDGWNGAYFANGDALDLYEKIRKLLERPEELTQMGKRSLEIICKEINIYTVLSGYVQAFEYVTGKRLST